MKQPQVKEDNFPVKTFTKILKIIKLNETKRFFIVSLFFFIILLNFSKADEDINRKIQFHTEKYKFLLDLINKNYVEDFDIDSVSIEVYKKLVNTLDTQSEYFTTEQMRQYTERFTGRQIGVGIRTVQIADTFTVSYVDPLSPADSAGFKLGDRIIKINDSSVVGISNRDFQEKLAGEVNSSVNIGRMSFADNTLSSHTLSRVTYTQTSIPAHFVFANSDVGYIHFNRFTSNSDIEFATAIQELQSAGMQSLILDLRNNSGGVLENAIKCADELLESGKELTYTKARNAEYLYRYSSEKDGELMNIPIVVLINEVTASAAEIIAGIVQDYDRGLVIGTRSYGKGTVQRSWNLTDGSGVRLTVAEYYTPSGRRVSKVQLDTNDVQLPPEITLNMDEETAKQIRRSIMNVGSVGEVKIYQSEGGRPIIGGGGITPDYMLSPDTTTRLFLLLKHRTIFDVWALLYYTQNADTLYAEYVDYYEFTQRFRITDEMIQHFAQIAVSNQLFNREMFETDKAKIIEEMRATLARFLWNETAEHYTRLNSDKQLIKAIELLPKAREMMK